MKTSLAFQSSCLEHVLEVARGTGLVEREVIGGAIDGCKTVNWFMRHEALTRAYIKLWNEQPELAKALSEVHGAFPDATVTAVRPMFDRTMTAPTEAEDETVA